MGLERASIPSPLGDLVATAAGDVVTGLCFAPASHEPPPRSAGGLFGELRRQLDSYWEGRLRRFTVPTAVTGTDFQRAVWRALERIPYGSSITYRELANEVGRPTAVRAVGHANGRNPLSILVPCHRVVGSNGSLTGYGGGIERKRALLELERATLRTA